MTTTATDDHLPRTRALVAEGMTAGLHTGVQLAASIDGHTVAELAMGQSRAGVPMTSDSLVLWLSSTKPIAAVAILQLVERGLVELDAPVARYVPEFAAHDKQTVTLRHVLTHTGGFRFVDIGWPKNGWNEIIARICNARLERDWKPGERAGYHPFTGWYVLGQIVARVDGRPFSAYVRSEIFEPLGMSDSWIGMPLENYRAYGQRIAVLPDTARPGAPAHRYASQQGVTDCVPGANGHGPMRELMWFYEALLAGGMRQGRRILTADSVALLSSRVRVGMYDETFKHKIDWGLGVIINSRYYGDDVPYGFGRFAAFTTFGHAGSQSSVGFADPERRLAVGCYLNGTPGEKMHQVRMNALLDALYEDLEEKRGRSSIHA